jgi:hypothetical protein
MNNCNKCDGRGVVIDQEIIGTRTKWLFSPCYDCLELFRNMQMKPIIKQSFYNNSFECIGYHEHIESEFYRESGYLQ